MYTHENQPLALDPAESVRPIWPRTDHNWQLDPDEDITVQHAQILVPTRLPSVHDLSTPCSLVPLSWFLHAEAMSTIQEFETALNGVVQAKRLSQSKMTRLTEITMKLIEHDTQLVSMLYRTHKSLPASCKISSLYVFDALARAARQQAVKHNLSERSGSGNCATFLLKVAGVLEGLFQDIIATGLPEAKEKTKKIHDIWVKGATFSPDILGRLSDIVSGKAKGAYHILLFLVCLPSEPRVNAPAIAETLQASPPPHSPVAPIQLAQEPAAATANSQATLLALLTQAAGQQVTQTPTNTVASPTTPAVDSTHLLLQYLQSASVNNTAANHLSHASPTPVSDTPPVSQVPKDPRITQTILIVVHLETSVIRRGAMMTEPTRAMTLGVIHVGEDGGIAGMNASQTITETIEAADGTLAKGTVARAVRKIGIVKGNLPRLALPDTDGNMRRDEFGRDIRSPSPSKSPTSNSATVHSTAASPITPSTPHDPKAEFSPTSTSNDPMSRSSSIAANTFSKDPDASNTSVESNTKSTSQSTGLDRFNMSTFDPTSPASWEALGKMWEAMNGYTPSTQELMQFMMMGAMNNTLQSKDWQQQENAGFTGGNDYGGGYSGGAASRGRGGHGGSYGNSRNNHHEWSNGGGHQSTDAVVLGGGEMDDEVPMDGVEAGQPFGDTGGRSGGRMQKVGDKWVFVRNDAAAY
ncbi:hypothetical protein NP233_g7244 [Leucocoprinus birnbaumii]|uniref:CID domain-containing protein n=1 Tax=Leucocoprinus birnbaumii TaxID=56174 RepID=A0AAD5VS79_9AGAR|nr:hypothetical protein NP233_g7244 [Leucocoprinus birnbaumii]